MKSKKTGGLDKKERNTIEIEDVESNGETKKEIDEILTKIASRKVKKNMPEEKTETYKKSKRKKKNYTKHKINPSKQIGMMNYRNLSLQNLNFIIRHIENTIKRNEENLKVALEQKKRHLLQNIRELQNKKKLYEKLKMTAKDETKGTVRLQDGEFSVKTEDYQKVNDICNEISKIDDGDFQTRLNTLLLWEQCVINCLTARSTEILRQKNNGNLETAETIEKRTIFIAQKWIRKMKKCAYLNFEDEYKTVTRTEKALTQFKMMVFLDKQYKEDPIDLQERLESEKFDKNKVYYYEHKVWSNERRSFPETTVSKDDFCKEMCRSQWMKLDKVNEMSIELKKKERPRKMKIVRKVDEKMKISPKVDDVIPDKYDEVRSLQDENSVGIPDIVKDKKEFEITNGAEQLSNNEDRIDKRDEEDSDYGIPPLGTGNDFPRTAEDYNYIEEVKNYCEALKKGRRRPVYYQIDHGFAKNPKALLKKKRFNTEDFMEEMPKTITLEKQLKRYCNSDFSDYDKLNAQDKIQKLIDLTEDLRLNKKNLTREQILELMMYINSSPNGVRGKIKRDDLLDQINKIHNQTIDDFENFLNKINKIKLMLSRLFDQHKDAFDIPYSAPLPQWIREEFDFE